MLVEIVGRPIERSERKRRQREEKKATETETVAHSTLDMSGRQEENNNLSDTRWLGRSRRCWGRNDTPMYWLRL